MVLVRMSQCPDEGCTNDEGNSFDSSTFTPHEPFLNLQYFFLIILRFSFLLFHSLLQFLVFLLFRPRGAGGSGGGGGVHKYLFYTNHYKSHWYCFRKLFLKIITYAIYTQNVYLISCLCVYKK